MTAIAELIPVQFSDTSSTKITVFKTQESSAPVLIIFPAMGVGAGYYKNYAASLTGKGVNIVAIDHRGHGHSSVRPSRKVNFSYLEQIEMEYYAIVTKVKEIFPFSKIVVMGHSLGGQMGSMFVSRYTELVNGFILNASCSVYYKGWNSGVDYGLLLFAAFCKQIGKILGYYPGHRIGFGGKEARGVINDWYYTARTGKFVISDSDFDYEKAMSEFALPVLAFTYEGDASAPYKAMENLHRKFVRVKTEHHHIVHPQSPAKKYNHYSWVKEPEISAQQIINWLKRI